MMTTTWNVLANAVKRLPGNYDGLCPVEEDFGILLRPLEHFPGWLEVCTPSGDSILFLPDGKGSGSLADWIYPLPEGAPVSAARREGIAVPQDILSLLRKE